MFNQKYTNVKNYDINNSNEVYPYSKQYDASSIEGFTSPGMIDTLQSTIDSANANLSNLDLIQTQLNLSTNLNQDGLLKKNELIRLQNDNLNDQLKDLELLQTNIITKDRIINQIDENIIIQNSNISSLITLLIFGILLIILIILFGYNTINTKAFFTYLTFLVIIFCIIFIYIYNIFYFKDSITYLGNRQKIVTELGTELKTWGKAIKTDVNSDLDYLKDEWIENNCGCPPVQEEEEEEILEEDLIFGETFEEQAPGYFYYDGNAPQQLLVPIPRRKNKLSIDWVDYSKNGQVYFDKDTNKSHYEDDNYYGSTPEQSLANRILNDNNPFVNNKTFTLNL
jgi:hypothetical protein